MRKKKHAHNWTNRRVAFVLSDAHHTIRLANISMPVRVKTVTEEGHIYEGPIQKVWDDVVIPKLVAKGYSERDPLGISSGFDLVGVLVASDDVLTPGQINWLEQSDTVAVEEGADRVKVEADHD
jgi:hypothetical protein